MLFILLLATFIISLPFTVTFTLYIFVLDPFDTAKDTSLSQLLTLFGSGFILAPDNKVAFVLKSAEFTSITYFVSFMVYCCCISLIISPACCP